MARRRILGGVVACAVIGSGLAAQAAMALPAAAAGPTVSVSAPPPVLEGDAGVQLARFAVTISEPPAAPVRLVYSTADGTATSPSDYAATSGGVLFFGPETTVVVEVPVEGDAVDEGDETFELVLSDVIGADVATSRATATIVDDDDEAPPPPPGVSVSAPPSVVEGDSGSQVVPFTVRLSAPGATPVGVTFALVAVENMAPGLDFENVSADLVFLPGETELVVEVDVYGDLVWEQDFGRLRGDLLRPIDVVIGTGQAEVRVIDDDPVPSATITPAAATVTEGDVVVPITVTMSSPTNLNQNFRLVRTGSAGTEDATIVEAFSFPRRGTERVLDLAVADDLLDEDDETVSLALESVPETYADGRVVFATIAAPGTSTITIADDDQPVDITPPVVQLSVSDGQVVPLGFVATCTASDDQSGVDGPCVVTTSGPGPGLVVVTGTARDVAGNVGSATATVMVSAPATSMLRLRLGHGLVNKFWNLASRYQLLVSDETCPTAFLPLPDLVRTTTSGGLLCARDERLGVGTDRKVSGSEAIVWRAGSALGASRFVGGTLKVEATSSSVIVVEARRGGALVATSVYHLATLAPQGTGALGDKWALPMPTASADSWRISASAGRFAIVGGADGSGDTTVALGG